MMHPASQSGVLKRSHAHATVRVEVVFAEDAQQAIQEGRNPLVQK